MSVLVRYRPGTVLAARFPRPVIVTEDRAEAEAIVSACANAQFMEVVDVRFDVVVLPPPTTKEHAHAH